MGNTSHILISGLSHLFSATGTDLQVLDDISLDIQNGEFVSLIGPSGSGKTTLLRIIGGLLTQTEGVVKLNGVEPRHAQREKAIGYVSQDAALLPWRNVEENVWLPMELNAPAKVCEKDELERLLAVVGLEKFRHYYPHQLSGGMKQRVALVRALLLNPCVLLMDEPLGSLDELTRATMRYELLSIWENSPKTVLFVTHSISEAVLLSDRVIVLSDRPGHIVLDTRIELPRPRTNEMERTTNFLDCADRVLTALSQNPVSASVVGTAAENN